MPAQPVEQHQPPAGPEWVHEIKHDGYRMIVRRDGDRVRLYSRKAIDWTARLPAIAESAARLGARSFTIDGEAVVIGPRPLALPLPALRAYRGHQRAICILEPTLSPLNTRSDHPPDRKGLSQNQAGKLSNIASR